MDPSGKICVRSRETGLRAPSSVKGVHGLTVSNLERSPSIGKCRHRILDLMVFEFFWGVAC